MNWSEWENGISTLRHGKFLAAIQQVTPSSDGAWRNRRVDIHHDGMFVAIVYTNGTADAEAIVEMVLRQAGAIGEQIL